nr:PREDICTED: uncharacterized protein C1orf177 homolog [Opisthocomus hoazin]
MGSQGRASTSGWARAERGSGLGQLPHFQCNEIMKRRKRQKERLGPGTYDIRDFLQEPGPSSLRGICDAGKHRFRDARGKSRGPKPSTSTVKGFLDKLMLKENKKKGCFSTLPRNPSCPTERIFWVTLSQCPREAYAVGPGSYNPKPVERSLYSSQPPFWSSAKRFDRKFYRLLTGNEVNQAHETFSFQNPVGVGCYNITEQEKYPQKMRYQSLYRCDAQGYLSNLKRDAHLLERLKPVGKNNWCDLVSAPHCPESSEGITAVFQA